jgi:hypothetical protein
MRDIVDNQILDVDGNRVTKVAAVEAEEVSGARPVVRCLLIGPEPLARRVGGRVAWLAGALTRRDRTIRVPWHSVIDVGPDVKLNVRGDETGATHAEDWVREHIIKFFPSLKR